LVLRDNAVAQLRELGPNHDDSTTANRILGVRLQQVGKLHEAKPMLQQVVAARMAMLEPQHLDTILARESLARLVLDGGSLSEALLLCDEALADCCELSERHPRVVTLRNVRALCLWAMGRLDEAKKQLEDVLAIRQQTFDPEHRDMLRVQFALAQLSGELESPFAAVESLTALADETEARIGPEQPATLRIRTAQAHWLGRDSKVSEALALLQEVIDIERRTFEQPHRFTLNALQDQARWIGESRHPADAVTQLEAVLADRLATMDDDHPDVYKTRYDLAYWLRRDDRVEESLALATDLLADCERTLDPIHPLIAQVKALSD
jgi:tetratricopeptide (TPR) repeat protein